MSEKKIVLDEAMIDLETMGTGPNAAIIQIGIVGFTFSDGGYVAPPGGPAIQIDVDLNDAIAKGGVVTLETVKWWQERGGLKLDFIQPVEHALDLVDRFFAENPAIDIVWAKGPHFDIAILEGYYQRLNRKCPWKYNRVRDMRTLVELADVLATWWEDPQRHEEVAHQATADCYSQIETCVAAYNALSGWKPKAVPPVDEKIQVEHTNDICIVDPSFLG